MPVLEFPFTRPYGGDSVPSVADKPPNGGNRVFYGGDQPASASAQSIDLSPLRPLIEQGEVYADLSAYLGGWQHQDDSGTAFVVWRDQSGNNLQTDSLGQVSAAARGNQTILLYRELKSIEVPSLAWSAYVQVRADEIPRNGNDNDGTVDNVSLELFLGDPHGNTGTVVDSDVIFPGTLTLPIGLEGQTFTGDFDVDVLTIEGGPFVADGDGEISDFSADSLVVGNHSASFGANRLFLQSMIRK